MEVTILKTFILIGVIDSFDTNYATVELTTNPPTNADAAMAVLPASMFPCKLKEGGGFFLVKLTEDADSLIICRKDK